MHFAVVIMLLEFKKHYISFHFERLLHSKSVRLNKY